MDDKKLIKTIMFGTVDERNLALKSFFTRPGLREKVITQVLKLGAKQVDVDDVFNDSFILMVKNIRLGDFKEKSSLETYFIGICKFRWLGIKRKRENKREDFKADTSFFDQHSAFEPSFDTRLINDEKSQILQILIEKTGEKCMRLLKLYYTFNYSMKNMVSEATLEFKTENAAKQAIAKCRKKLRQIINQAKAANFLRS